MKPDRWSRLPLAMLLALVVNSLGLYLIIQVNKYVHAPAKEAHASTNAIVFHEPPKKKTHQHVKQEVVRARPRAMLIPVPDLPSNISSEHLLAGIGSVDLLGDLIGQQQGWNAELILKEEAVDEPPRVIRRASLDYPGTAEDRGIEGYVMLKLHVSSSGRVEKVWVTKAEPPGIFEAAAEKAVRQYQFSPARFKGQPVAVLCSQKIVFKLGN